MLKTLLNLAGFAPAAPPAPPARPPSRRGVAPAPLPRATVVEPGATPEEVAAIVARQQARDARNESVFAEKLRASEDLRFAAAVRLILRAYDPVDLRYADPGSVRVAEERVGEPVAEYLRACRHAGIRIPPIGEAVLGVPARTAAYRAELVSRAATDFEGWDRGAQVIAALQSDARRHGRPVPADLVIPAEVLAGILAMQRERIARLQRRTGKGGAGTETATATAAPPAGTETETKEDDETPTTPGSKR